MMKRRRFTRRTPRIGTGGVVMLSSLIFLVAMVALIAGSLTVRQLTSAAAESKRLFGVQERADMLLRLQLDQQTSLRGFLISHNNAFLEPYLSEADPFEEQARTLRGDLSATDLAVARQHLDEMLTLHRRWRRNYADPLIVNPSGRQISSLEAYGKLLDDGIRTQGAALRAEIDAKNRRVEASLETNIDSTVGYSVGFVSIVALVVIYLALAQRSTYVAFMRERAIAENLQAVLGMGWQSIPGCTVGSCYVSATTGANIGGDLFDAWRLDDHRGAIMIADMSGKGIEAVVNTAFCKYSIRALLANERDPARVMTEFNRLFSSMVSDPSMFAVVFLGVLDAETGVLQYVSAGHEPAFLRHEKAVRTLDIGGPIVGMEANSAYAASSVTLVSGDLVLLATDGLTESRDRSGAMLGAEAVAVALADAPARPQEICDGFIEMLRRRGRHAFADDLAMLAVRFEGSGGGQSASVAEGNAE